MRPLFLSYALAKSRSEEQDACVLKLQITLKVRRKVFDRRIANLSALVMKALHLLELLRARANSFGLRGQFFDRALFGHRKN